MTLERHLMEINIEQILNPVLSNLCSLEIKICLKSMTLEGHLMEIYTKQLLNL